MNVNEKLDRLYSLCTQYRTHLEKTKNEYNDPDDISIFERKITVIGNLMRIFNDPDREECLREFNRQFDQQARNDISENRGVDSLGVLFLKTVATILSLGTVLLVNRFNFWKSEGGRKCTEIDNILKTNNNNQQLPDYAFEGYFPGEDPTDEYSDYSDSELTW